MTDEEFLEGVTKPVLKLNGAWRLFYKERISYEDVLGLIGVLGTGQTYTVSYLSKSKGVKGTLSKGESIEMIDRLIINADRTDKA